jgi:hypothetical protein
MCRYTYFDMKSSELVNAVSLAALQKFRKQRGETVKIGQLDSLQITTFDVTPRN